MKLKRLVISGFRSYSQRTVFDVGDLNVIIGRNDVGKSTILEALDIFFNNKPDSNDLSIEDGISEIEITCIFNEIPSPITLDQTSPTSLESEFLVNSRGELEIKKQFSFTATGIVSEKVFIVCDYPDKEELNKLMEMKNTPLKTLFYRLELEEEGVDKRNNAELRKAIRDHYYPDGNVITAPKDLQIEGRLDNEDNRKKIWSNLKKYLPLYSLFFVDKPLNDQDSDIQDPMKEIIKEVLKREEILPLLNGLKKAVQEASSALADDTITELNKLDSGLAETLRSSFPKEPSWNTIFKLALEDERGIPLNKRGSGLRRLVLLSFFRAQVENRRSDSAPDIIYALEEPETSQHPDFQLMIVNALKELSETDNAQVLFTTHNSNLAKEIPRKALRYIYKDLDDNIHLENGTNADGTDNEEIIDKIIETLGALPDPKNKVKVLVFVEGENDINALIRYSRILHEENNDVLYLENNEAVAFIPTGGSQLKHYIEKKHLDGLLQAQVHIYDSDKPEYIAAVEELNAEEDPRKVGFNTSMDEMENFLHHEAIQEAYADLRINIELEEIDAQDVPLLVARTVHEVQSVVAWDDIDEDPVKREEKQKRKVSRAKRLLNKEAIDKMTIERIDSRGVKGEIIEWLETINSFIN
ncbi:ATP-binding protein [Roseivirga sp.]|uniref:ATP-binding protein n=1 Tax=Roseivirga sp. TaxID=1964215 RepID=UPI003B522D44